MVATARGYSEIAQLLSGNEAEVCFKLYISVIVCILTSEIKGNSVPHMAQYMRDLCHCLDTGTVWLKLPKAHPHQPPPTPTHSSNHPPPPTHGSNLKTFLLYYHKVEVIILWSALSIVMA